MQVTDLNERYGIRQRRSPRAQSGQQCDSHRLWWIVSGVLALGVVGFWALTALSPAATVETQTVGYEVNSPTQMRLDARVSVQPGTPLACVIEAKNTISTVVGWKVIELDPVSEAHQVVSTSVETTQPADVAMVRECWVNE